MRLAPILLASATFAAAGCSGGPSSPSSPAPALNPASTCGSTWDVLQSLPVAVEENAAFAATLYAPVAAATGAGRNVVFSPLSVSSTLMMLGAGAAGETATQIQKLLHLPAPPANVASAYGALVCEDQTNGSSNGDVLLVASSVWAQQGRQFSAPFLSTLQDAFGAPLHQVDLAGDPAVATGDIDTWVSQRTQSRIPELLQPGDLPAGTVLVLADAIYFEGQWSEAFDPSQTTLQPFTLSDGSQVMVPTMSGSHLDVGAGSAQGVDVYELGYKDGALAMDFLEPNSGSLADLEARLTPELLSSLLMGEGRGGCGRPGQFKVPKFSLDRRSQLAPALASMGLTDLFDPAKADLTGMDGQKDLFVGPVVHEATIQVDEQGTVAAAATGAVIEPPVCAPMDVWINRPFLFLIRNTQNGDILFMGRVEDPRQP
ncbi:MAG TPA: serpin family protein [Polyangiaceae bacterium]|nr:serpin family protein [Polyangiaceae bacterium]